MKFHLTFTKIFFVSLFVLGFVLPVTAEHVPQPYKSLDNNIVDWSDEFDQTSYSMPMKTDLSGSTNFSSSALKTMPNTLEGPVVDWWDEFEYQGSEKPASETKTASKAMSSEGGLDEYWDWEAWQSM